MEHAVELLPHLYIRRSQCLSHGGIHVAVSDVYVRKILVQLVIHILQIAAYKMMNAAGEHKKCPRTDGKFFYNVCNTVYDELFHVTVKNVVFFNGNCRESFFCVHFCGSKHYAPKTALRANKNLM